MTCITSRIITYDMIAGDNIGLQLNLQQDDTPISVKAFYNQGLVDILDDDTVAIGGVNAPNSIVFRIKGGIPNSLYEITFRVVYSNGDILQIPFIVRTSSWVTGNYTPPLIINVETAKKSSDVLKAQAVIVRTTNGVIKSSDNLKSVAIVQKNVNNKTNSFDNLKCIPSKGIASTSKSSNNDNLKAVPIKELAVNGKQTSICNVQSNAIKGITATNSFTSAGSINGTVIAERSANGSFNSQGNVISNARADKNVTSMLTSAGGINAVPSTSVTMPAITENLEDTDILMRFSFDGHPTGYTGAVARVQRITNANVTVTGTQTLDVGLDSRRVFDWATTDTFRAGADLVLVGFLYNGTLCPVVKGGTGQMWMWKLGTGRITTGTTLNETTGQLAMDSDKGSQGASPLAINDATNFAYIEYANANFSLASGLEFHVYWQPMARKDGSVNVPTGTYSQSGTTLTITETAHGLRVGQLITFTPTSGTGAVTETYAVQSITNANVFVVIASNSVTTTGNCIIDPTGLGTTSRSECILSYGKSSAQNAINLELGGNASRFVRRVAQSSEGGGTAGDQNISGGAIGASKQYGSYISSLALNNTDFRLYEGATQVGNTTTLSASNITANNNLTQGNLRLGARPSLLTGFSTTQANVIYSGVIVTKTLTDFKRASLTARWMSYTEQQDAISTADLLEMFDDIIDFRNVPAGSNPIDIGIKGNTSIQFNTTTSVGGNAPDWTFNDPVPFLGINGARSNKNSARSNRATSWRQPSGDNYWCGYKPTRTAVTISYLESFATADLISQMAVATNDPLSYPSAGTGSPSDYNFHIGTHHAQPDGMTSANIAFDTGSITGVSGAGDNVSGGDKQPTLKYTQPLANESMQLPANIVSQTGTYTQSGTTVTVTATSHGLSVNQPIAITVQSGAGISENNRTVASITTNTFTYTSSASNTQATSANLTVFKGFTITYGQDPVNYNQPVTVATSNALDVSFISTNFGKTSPAPEGDINPGFLFNFPQIGNICLTSIFTVNNNSFDPNATLSARNLLYRKATAKLWTTPTVGAKIGGLDASYARFIDKANVCQPANGAFLQNGAYLYTLKGSYVAVMLSSQEFTTKMAMQVAIFAPFKLFGL